MIKRYCSPADYIYLTKKYKNKPWNIEPLVTKGYIAIVVHNPVKFKVLKDIKVADIKGIIK